MRYFEVSTQIFMYHRTITDVQSLNNSQVMLKPPSNDPLMGGTDEKIIDFSDVDIRLGMFVYVSREKRPGYDHNKKAGAMNALVRASAILSNGPFILNLDCDHYIYNCKAIREGMCFMMDRGGENICYIQFPQRFEGIDPSDRYANNNTVFFDGNMRALDGVQVRKIGKKVYNILVVLLRSLKFYAYEYVCRVRFMSELDVCLGGLHCMVSTHRKRKKFP
jgi:hypothetical protein